ncbi:MAG: nicotinamide riboside transporter PnuC [Halieaceae bacterium]|jgi:nicotinamide mononucleotide transporter|nr:nicotinamide riboside transporter PnuC [Halieaceae bacterium]
MTAIPELAATLLALAYVVLAIQENRLCFIAGFISAALYLWIFWQVQLYMESALQIFYALISLYGWWHWGGSNTPTLPISRWSIQRHAAALLCIAAGTIASGWLLATHTDAAMPYVDSFTTISAVITTWMVAQKLLENWLYWVVIDVVSALMYVERGLWLTSALFAMYTVLAVTGYLAWRRHYRSQPPTQ